MPSRPRDGWLATVEAQGLTYAMDRSDTGAAGQYWHEDVRYEFSETEIGHLEVVTERLHAMVRAAVARMVDDPALIDRHGLPAGTRELLARSFADPGEISLHGRFDLAWGGEGTGDPVLLEYNADTPAGLVEAAVCQWHWLEDTQPRRDQWNMLHERYLKAWTRLRESGVELLHVAVGQHEPTEDWATVAYLRDSAHEAGLSTVGLTMEDIGWDPARRCFVDLEDREITHCFVMFPKDWMLGSRFGTHLLQGGPATRWVEPFWKLLAGSKAVLPVLWEMYPDHPNLLPAHFDHPHGMEAWVSKPLLGWEGDGVVVSAPGVHEMAAVAQTAGQQRVFQQYRPLPDLDGYHPVLGTWVVDGRAAGLGIRESRTLVTDTRARFVPHLMTAPRSSAEQVTAWLAED